MANEEPVTYLLRAPGCFTGPCESVFNVAVSKALKMPTGTEIIPLYISVGKIVPESSWGKALHKGDQMKPETQTKTELMNECLAYRAVLKKISELPDFMPAKDAGNLMNLRAAKAWAQNAIKETP